MEGSKVLRKVKSVFEGKDNELGVQKTLYQQVIVNMVNYGFETWKLREAERRCLNMFEIKCLRPMVGVTRWDRVRN